MPLVSVIVPCFNAESSIFLTLTSIKRQSFSDFECIVVDDFSADKSSHIIEHFIASDSRFKLFRHSSNLGVTSSRNTALNNSCGRYVAFLDSDDLWAPDFLINSLLLHNTHSGGFVHSPYWRFRESSGCFYTRFVSPPEVVSLKNIYQKNYLPLLTTVVDRGLVGDFRFPDCRPEDYALWTSFFENPAYSSKSTLSPSAFYRVSYTQRSSNKFRAVRRLYHFYSGQGFSSMSSLMLTTRWLFFSTSQRFSPFRKAKGYVYDELSLLHSSHSTDV